MTIGRILVALLSGTLLIGPAASVAGAGEKEEYVMRREDDATEVVTVAGDDDDDDGDDSNTSRWSSDHDSNDRTGSGHTAVSRDRDRSRGDKTRDRTKDGPGSSKRDWSGGHTNDRSRNDSR